MQNARIFATEATTIHPCDAVRGLQASSDMRLPSRPDSKKTEGSGFVPPRRDPSFVDRQRLDSDVRCFLRQPSTPWMVFDRDDVTAGVPPEPEPAPTPFVGSVLAGSGSSVVREAGFFPQTDSYAPELPAEASTAAMVTELADAPSAEVPIEALPRPKRAWAPITGAVVVALAGAGLLVALFSPSVHGEARETKKSAAAAMSLPDAPPPNLDPQPEPKAEKASTPAAPVTKAVSTSKFGKLTITGAATRHHVFMDGKRFLGTGTRSFTVMCGTHAIGIDSRTDTKDLDVPCGGELVVSE